MEFISSILRELDIFFSFTWMDWSAALIPATIFAVGPLRDLPFPRMLSSYAFTIWWTSHYLYFFTLTNQISGVVEDSINKKYRPIPSGQVTLTGATVRWLIVSSSYLSISVYEPTIFPETLVWILTTLFACFTPAGNHWFGKNNISMSAGTWALLSGTWKSIAPHSPKSKMWVYGMAAWIGIMMHIQDLRDIEGDAACGRKTMCIEFGDRVTRLLISFVFIPFAMYTLYLARIMQLAPISITVLHIFVSYRVLNANGRRYDHKTYMYFTYVFCAILAIVSAENIDMSF